MKKEVPMADKDFQTRNNMIDFLVFTRQSSTSSIQIRVRDKNIWLIQKSMTQLFECSIDNTSPHLRDIFKDGRLIPGAITKEPSTAVLDGKQHKTKSCSFDAVISVGYRISSLGVTRFHQWTAKVLRAYTVQGCILDKGGLENGQISSEEYFEHLLDKVKEIRANKRKFYQEITDIYAITVGYSKDAVTTKEFFKTVRNEPHYAIHGHIVAEVIAKRVDHKKEHTGLATWKDASGGKIVETGINIAKSYLSRSELQDLSQSVSMYLDYAERQARRHIPIAMEDWTARLEVFLKMNDEDILLDKGKTTHKIVRVFTESEFEEYGVIQDQLCESGFDKLVMKVDLQ